MNGFFYTILLSLRIIDSCLKDCDLFLIEGKSKLLLGLSSIVARI